MLLHFCSNCCHVMPHEHSSSDQPFRSVVGSTTMESWFKSFVPGVVSPLFYHCKWVGTRAQKSPEIHTVFSFGVLANAWHICKRWNRWCFGHPEKGTPNVNWETCKLNWHLGFCFLLPASCQVHLFFIPQERYLLPASCHVSRSNPPLQGKQQRV